MSDTPNNGHCQQNLRRVVISSLIGAVIEWYDFFLYGVVAGLVFNKIYFPAADPTVGTILAFATFAVGFVARPFGGIIFGHFGDKLGRKKMLVLTLEIMGVATVGIGLIPATTASASGPPSCWSSAAWPRASASVANGAAPCSWPSNPRRLTSAPSTAACPRWAWPSA